MSISNLTPSQLRQAASIIEQIEKLQNELNQLQGGKAITTVVAAPAIEVNGKPARKARKISAAGIARIRAGQKARWAKFHSGKNK